MIYYPWLNDIYNRILNSYRTGKGHHALILDCKWNNGEDILINMLIRWLMCSSPDSTKFCNICYDCRLMSINNHPNYFFLDVQNNKQSLGIDDIKSCINSIYRYTQHNAVKIIFIKYIEYLSEQAVNVLLKILEEPPDNTYFFLKTQKYISVPKTVLSRCITWAILPPEESLGLQWLIKRHKLIDKLSALIALRLCHGFPIEASFMLTSSIWKNRSSFFNTISNIFTKKNVLDILSFLNDYRYNYAYLYWFITLLIDAIKWKQNIVDEKFIVNLDQIQLSKMLSIREDLISLHNQLKQWLVLFYYFQKFDNINRELLLTCRLLNWEQGIVENCFNSWSI